MLTVGRRQTARLAAAVLASGLLAVGAMAGAGSAVADNGGAPAAGGATATLEGLTGGHYQTATIHDGSKTEKVAAALLTMDVDGGGKINSYCIDIHHPTGGGAKYAESAWNSTSLGSNSQAGKIKWILENSYPQVNDLSKLASEAGVSNLTDLQAAAGTQVAIWKFSDGVNVTADDSSAQKLADYLTSNAGNASEPQASLSLSPVAVSGKSGSKLGPVTVHINGSSAQVGLSNQTPAGVKLVDATGKPVTSASNGEQLYFDVPAGTNPGTATLMAQSTTTVPIGRAFTGTWQGASAQTLILAGSSDSAVSAQASATWAMQGPIPALSSMVDCAKSGVDVTATNSGDQDFTFQLAGKQYTVAAGKSQTITVPVKEDQSYSIAVSGPNGFSKTFTGVLDCKVSGSGGVASSPAPAPSAASGGTNLAETGSSSATPVIAGVAIALVVVGGGTVFFIRKRKSPSAS